MTMSKGKLSEAVVVDLSGVAMDRCNVVMRDILQLVDDPQQKMIVSTNVAALLFGLAARLLQHHIADKDGAMPEWPKAVDAVVYHVAKLALETPPPADRTGMR